MKINFSQVFKGKTVPESSLYMIYGKPYHLITEARHRIRSLCSHNKDSQTKVYFVDADFKIEELRSDLESLSLFNFIMIYYLLGDFNNNLFLLSSLLFNIIIIFCLFF